MRILLKVLKESIEYLFYIVIWYSVPIYLVSKIEEDIGVGEDYFLLVKIVWLILCIFYGLSLKKSIDSQK